MSYIFKELKLCTTYPNRAALSPLIHNTPSPLQAIEVYIDEQSHLREGVLEQLQGYYAQPPS